MSSLGIAETKKNYDLISENARLLSEIQIRARSDLSNLYTAILSIAISLSYFPS